MNERAPSNEPPLPPTTMHVRRAIDGDGASLGWIIAHFTPLLVAQAEYRLGKAMRKEVDAEDLVHGAWVIALPRLGELKARDGRWTKVLLKFLSTSIVLQIKKLVATRGRRPLFSAEGLAETPEETRGTPTRVATEELQDRVRSTIDQLSASDREVVVLRGIEQRPAREVAEILGIAPPAVDQRYSRALKRLRERLPASVFDELGD